MASETAVKEIGRMLNAFPQTAGNYLLLLDTYERELEGLSDEAIIRAAGRFMRGEVPEQSKQFAPSLASFRDDVVRSEEHLSMLNRPRLPPPRYFPGPLAPFQIRQQKRLSENSHLPVLHENISLDQWKKLSAAKEIPVGSKWLASLGIVYGPNAKQQES